MCGIYAVSGSDNAGSVALVGIKRLEYRGYDSWGVAVADEKKIHLKKEVGHIPTQAMIPEGQFAIGHTRWATHGGVTQANAHPHLSSDGSFALVHNGIVENESELRNLVIAKGFRFISQTDSEVIVRLVEQLREEGLTLDVAFTTAMKMVEGRNAVVLLSATGEILAFRDGSPLVVGRADDTYFISSDTHSLAKDALSSMMLDDGTYVKIHNGTFTLTDIKGNQIKEQFEILASNDTSAELGTFDHFMSKEIWDTPQAVTDMFDQSLNDILHLAKTLTTFEHVFVVGAGTAGVASKLIAYYLRTIAHIPAYGILAAEAESYLPLINEKTLVIAPSQSGETADVLVFLGAVKKRKATIATYVNMPNSMMNRIADVPIMAHAGPEICVMSTKVFTSQVLFGYLLAHGARGSSERKLKELGSQLRTLFVSQLKDPQLRGQIMKAALLLKNEQKLLLVGVGGSYIVMEEGMIKITEGSYIQAQAVQTGNLKHFAITLIEDGTPVLVNMLDTHRPLLVTAVKEMRARGAKIIAIDSMRDPMYEHLVHTTDHSPAPELGSIIPIQLLAYHLALVLGRNIDKPRNIAKSVTVV